MSTEIVEPPAPEPQQQPAGQPENEAAAADTGSATVADTTAVGAAADTAIEPESNDLPTADAEELAVEEPVTEEPVAEEPAAEVRARRRPSTAVLLVTALVLGPLIGGGIGYAIQSGRPATPLPPLQVALPKYPSTVIDAKAAADAQPKPLNIDGDLRTLLINKPADAQDWSDFGHSDGTGWLTVGDSAMSFGDSAKEFTTLLGKGFRRDASVTWAKGDIHYQVELVQYTSDMASSAVDGTQRYAYPDSQPLDGTASGFYSAPAVPENYADSTEQFYFGTAVARRGDVVMRVSIFSPSQVNADELKDIAKRQWERLV